MSFDLEWSGTSFTNTAVASGRITIDDALLLNPGNNSTLTTPGLVTSLTITISGASSGNGIFGLGDFSGIRLNTGLQALNFAQELVGQPTDQDPWGTSQPGETGGDFNLFFSSPGAPSGTFYFELTTNEVSGDKMLLTSFRPVQVLSQTDPASKYAYGENIGWVNAGPTNHEVTVHFDGDSGYLSGYAWGENIGWICFPTNGNGGVNLNASGDLSGYAWGENVGWICFPTNGNGGVSISTANGEFSGDVWGENIGWLKFKGSSPDYGVRTLAFDTQAQGTPNWWLVDKGVSEVYDEGDGVPAWKEYVADTDPNNPSNFFKVISFTTTGTTVEVEVWPTSTRRYYTLEQTKDLTANLWSNVTGQVSLPGVGGPQCLEDANAGVTPTRAYRVEVSVSQ